MRAFSKTVVAVALSAGISPGLPASETAKAAGGVHFNTSTGHINVDVRNMALHRLLAEVGRQAGVTILMDPRVEAREVTILLQDVPLDQGLRRMVKDLSYVLVYDRKSVPPRVREVRLLPAGKEGSPNLTSVSRDARDYAFDDSGRPVEQSVSMVPIEQNAPKAPRAANWGQ